jgi:very-short-patch-repair endonuclease
VADFYCPAAKLVIEIDGLVHDFEGPAKRDENRNEFMQELGLRIIRVPASEVFENSTAVADGIIGMCTEIIGPSTA